MWEAFKRGFHRYGDPLLAARHASRTKQTLQYLTDGEYRVPLEVPYIPQFASPDLIADYIHNRFDGRHDPHWHTFGAPDPTDYAFWAHRVCALAVIKMAALAHGKTIMPSLWELVQQGLTLNGYQTHDEQGRLVDRGWHFEAQVQLAAQYGLKLQGYSYVSAYGICQEILAGHVVGVTVSPELGERVRRSNRYGGHVVLAYGFHWKAGDVSHLILHNPSGRYPELQAGAIIPLGRFLRDYAYRYAVFTAL